MAGVYLPPVIERLDIDAIGCFLDPDGRFPHHEPNPLLPEKPGVHRGQWSWRSVPIWAYRLRRDAVRWFFIDDKGEFVAGDFLPR